MNHDALEALITTLVNSQEGLAAISEANDLSASVLAAPMPSSSSLSNWDMEDDQEAKEEEEGEEEEEEEERCRKRTKKLKARELRELKALRQELLEMRESLANGQVFMERERERDREFEAMKKELREMREMREMRETKEKELRELKEWTERQAQETRELAASVQALKEWAKQFATVQQHGPPDEEDKIRASIGGFLNSWTHRYRCSYFHRGACRFSERECAKFHSNLRFSLLAAELRKVLKCDGDVSASQFFQELEARCRGTRTQELFERLRGELVTASAMIS